MSNTRIKISWITIAYQIIVLLGGGVVLALAASALHFTTWSLILTGVVWGAWRSLEDSQ